MYYVNAYYQSKITVIGTYDDLTINLPIDWTNKKAQESFNIFDGFLLWCLFKGAKVFNGTDNV